jgi:sugar diacid utilization regulator
VIDIVRLKQFHPKAMADAAGSCQADPPRAPGGLQGEPPRLARSVDRLAALVRLAVEDDDSNRLVVAAAAELGRPLGLVGLAGEPLAHAPDDAGGRQALAVAGAIARRAATAPSPGWRVLTVAPGHSRRAVLAVGPGRRDAPDGTLLEPIVELLGEQLVRAGLRQDQTEAFLGRLVSEPAVGFRRARAEAAALGLALPDAYWPAVVAWDDGAPGPAELDGIGREARRLAPGSLAVTVHARMVLLHPSGAGASEVLAWVEQIIAVARTTAPSLDARAVAADREVALSDLSTQVTRLARLCAHRGAALPVTRARQHVLEGLLTDSVAPSEARRFVDDLLGAVIAWDHDHRSDLLRVLEAALDHPRHDVAARRCFMHRNTFRHRLQKARDLVGDDLTDPDTRLAVHVALKLRRVTASTDRGGEAERADAARDRRFPSRDAEERLGERVAATAGSSGRAAPSR